MKLHSISTELGPAVLASIEPPFHPVDAPEGYGIVLWGRCDRSATLTIALASRALWIADYDIRNREAIVVSPIEIAGKRLDIDTLCVDISCPKCNGIKTVSNGASYRCKGCGHQWRKSTRRQPIA